MPNIAPDSEEQIKQLREKWKGDFFASMPPRERDPITGRLAPLPGLDTVFGELPIEEVDDLDLLQYDFNRPPMPTPFTMACRIGPVSAVEEILAIKKRTQAFLHWGLIAAIMAGNVDTARFLLSDAGAPITRSMAQFVAGNTPDDSKIAMFEVLFQHGWTPNSFSFYGDVLLDKFVTNIPIMRWFLDHGADPNLGMPRYGGSRNGGPDTKSCRALQNASAEGSLEAVKMLLEAGAKVENGNPLHRAAEARRPEGLGPYYETQPVRLSKLEFDEARIPIMQLLVEAGADVNKKEDTLYMTQTYPIVYAVSVGAVERAKWLLDHGADPTLPSKDDYFGTAIETADKMGTEEMKLLFASWKQNGKQPKSEPEPEQEKQEQEPNTSGTGGLLSRLGMFLWHPK